MIVLEGMTHIDLASSGGGYGVEVGLGRGHGGLGVNYQKVNFATSGLHTSDISLTYAPPTPPDSYDKNQYYRDQCEEILKRAEDKVKELDEFSTSTKGIHPGGSNAGHSNLISLRSTYQRMLNYLVLNQSYDSKKAIWEKTRVCLRCGDCFITNQDQQSSQVSERLPEFKFTAEERRCPECKDYMWKTAKTFFTIKIRELEDNLKFDLERQKEAVNYANNPNEGGFWKKLGRKLLTLSPEDANKKVAHSQVKLAGIYSE